MKRFLRIYTQCMKTAVARAAAYRMDFLLSMFITLLGNIAFPLITLLIYHSGASFPGWNLYEVLLIQSIYTLSNGLSSIVFAGVLWVTMGHIREGNFEVVLLKPLNPLTYLISTNFNVECFSMVIGGLVIFFIAITHIGTFTVTLLLSSFLLFLGGLAVMSGMQLLMAATSFKWVGNSRIPELFDSIKVFGQYPLTIFPTSIRMFATYLIPVGMIGFLPAAAILGRVPCYTYIAILPCGLFFLFGIWIYQRMIRNYEGVGG